MPNEDDKDKIIEIERELDKLRVHPTIRIPAGEFDSVPCDGPSPAADNDPGPAEYEPSETSD